ncbi:MAG: YggS family pyridoxal phosphate-dependent enzyme [Alphaproteobacteria bacterium]|nr:YggS family pyridoxal phosphate-dependent enzyme [Alphaproteobacteria bacterium]
MTDAVANNLRQVGQRIAVVAQASGRDASDITLIAVSKGQVEQRLDDALAAGQLVFGENRVQEAQSHWTARRAARRDLELHLIGPLQTNKVRDAVELFDVIQTVDRPKLVDRLVAAFDKIGTARDCFVQINTGEESQKAGIWPDAADDFIAYCRSAGMPVVGLMCIPPLDEAPAPHFALLRTIAERNEIAGLSMGMSADFEMAITLGATHVRVGTGVFGARQVGYGAPA